LRFNRGLTQIRQASAPSKCAPFRCLINRGDILGYQHGFCIVGKLLRQFAVHYEFLSASTPAPSETKRGILSSLVEAEEPSIKSQITITGSATEFKAATALFEKMRHPERNSTDTKMMVDQGDRTTADSRSAKDQSSPFNPLTIHRSVDPTLEAEDTQFSNEPGTEFSVGSDMPRARPPSTRAASTGLATQVQVNRAGFIFEDSDVRYLSRAELEKLPPEQLRI
jgi:hypothetical protein